MPVPDRPDPDEIITSAWGDWVHDAVAARFSRFEYRGLAAGQGFNPGDLAQCNYNGNLVVNTIGAAVSAAGLFTCPANLAGLWHFDYTVDWDANGTGTRAAYMAPTPAGLRHASASGTHLGAGNGVALTGAAIVHMAAGATMAVIAYHNASAAIGGNRQQSRYAGVYLGSVT